MRTEHPSLRHIPALRRLWQEAFGDTDAFLDSFFATAFSPERCLCILREDTAAAALYWLDCSLHGRPMAYLYAVATAKAYRGQGLCRALMADTHSLLTARGYDGVLLVPQEEGLRRMYASMGYENAGTIREFSCAAEDPPVSLRAIGPEEFAALRRSMLPQGAVLQEGESLAFLAQQLQFYAGEGILLAAWAEKGCLQVPELLGNTAAAGGIVRTLGCSRGNFRSPGGNSAFAMFHPLVKTAEKPNYFAFAFD